MMNRNKFFSGLIVLILIFSSIGCNDGDRDRELEETNMRLDSLSTALEAYKKERDSLRLLLQKGELATGYPVYFNKGFDTIDNPKEFISNSLKEKPELIPLEAKVGGTMAFRNVQVISENWVLATYDDGHIQGKTIYHFELHPNGELKFTAEASRLP
jgi:hypothetical protein